jgi:hypothetical protein
MGLENKHGILVPNIEDGLYENVTLHVELRACPKVLARLITGEIVMVSPAYWGGDFLECAQNDHSLRGYAQLSGRNLTELKLQRRRWNKEQLRIKERSRLNDCKEEAERLGFKLVPAGEEA